MRYSFSRYKIDLYCCIGGVALGVGFAAAAHAEGIWHFASLALAYAATSLLIAAMLVGPIRVLRGKRPLASSHVRRHLGVWSGVFALCHVVAGLNVHLNGNIPLYFFTSDHDIRLRDVRADQFGFANHTGLIATVIVVILLTISNDYSVAKLGVLRWKGIQRATYFCSALILAHAILYQFTEKRIWPLILAVIVGAGVVLWLQLRASGSIRRHG